jgi:pilus assembly protein Flp/PilA
MRKKLYSWLCKMNSKLANKEEGATMVEYGLLVALIAVVCIGAVTALGGSLSTMFTNISGSVTAAS